MSKGRILIADKVHTICATKLREAGYEVEEMTGAKTEELAGVVGEFDGIVVRSGVKITRAAIEAMTRMKVIGRAGAGVDNIDVEAATERGIPVMNVPGGNTLSAAEHTIAMLLAAARRISAAHASLRDEKWERSAFTGVELFGKTVGVLGVGRIGREVAQRLRSFGTKIIGFDPFLSREAMIELGIEAGSFEEVLTGADILTLHLPLSSETRGLIGADELSRVKPGVIIVNCARGGIIDEDALLAALIDGRVGAAAIDVFAIEPPALPSPLIDHPNVVATPHIAASTVEAQERVAEAIAMQFISFLAGHDAIGLVNAGRVEGAYRQEFAHYAAAAHRLGQVMGALQKEPSAIDLTIYGEAGTSAAEGLRAAYLMGLFEGSDVSVTPVNADAIAESRGIVMSTQTASDHEAYHFLICSTQTGTEGIQTGAMTLFGEADPRLVMINDAWFEISPEGHLLLIEHRDQPGVLAAIATAIGERDINISDVSLGRRRKGTGAMTVIRTDTPCPDETLHAIRSNDVVETLHAISL